MDDFHLSLRGTLQKLDDEGRGKEREKSKSGRIRRGAGAMAERSSISFVSGDDLEVLQGPKVAVVDVRDEERELDGHIAGSMHFASESFEEKLPELLEQINGKEAVVFHCAKSQVRGPTCARILCDHLNTAVTEGKMDKVPKVVVLERGFNGWAMAGRPVCSCGGTICNKI